MDVSAYTEVWHDHPKEPKTPRAVLCERTDTILAIAAHLGQSLDRNASILDFGCGIGDTVELLLERGYDAYGVDVGEWWGKQFSAYWQKADVPNDNLIMRLKVAQLEPYNLPFHESQFDLIISSQVFEHVFNYTEVFSELGRILKPGGLSINIFPGRWTFMEPHLFVPIIPLCRYKWWLGAWAMVCRRHVPSWRGEREYLIKHMQFNNYPSRSDLTRYANQAGMEIAFNEAAYIEYSNSRPHRLLELFRRFGLGSVSSVILQRLCQRAMILRHPR